MGRGWRCYGITLDTSSGMGWGQPWCCSVHKGMECGHREGCTRNCVLPTSHRLLNPAWSSAVLLRLQQQDLGRKGNSLHGAGGYRASQPCTEIPLGWLWPAPSPGSGTPACACCQQDLQHPREHSQRELRCPGVLPAQQECEGQGPSWCSCTSMGCRVGRSTPRPSKYIRGLRRESFPSRLGVLAHF